MKKTKSLIRTISLQIIASCFFISLVYMYLYYEVISRFQVVVFFDFYFWLIFVSYLFAITFILLSFYKKYCVIPLQQLVFYARGLEEKGSFQENFSYQTYPYFQELLHCLQKLSSQKLDLESQSLSTMIQVRGMSEKIQKENYDLTQEIKHQVHTLENTSSSMEEFTNTIKDNAHYIKSLTEIGKTTMSISEEERSKLLLSLNSAIQMSQKAVVSIQKTNQKVVVAIEDIAQRSEKISSIIGVMNDIAFQTNLLSLNAAVEASRAGEQGKGFSAVAAEIRSLAGRSSKAARQISTLIVDSLEHVKKGRDLVQYSDRSLQDMRFEIEEELNQLRDQSVANLDKILKAVENVSEMLGNITLTSTEQVKEFSQIHEATKKISNQIQNYTSIAQSSVNRSDDIITLSNKGVSSKAHHTLSIPSQD